LGRKARWAVRLGDLAKRSGGVGRLGTTGLRPDRYRVLSYFLYYLVSYLNFRFKFELASGFESHTNKIQN
jgi:hypothetical protein